MWYLIYLSNWYSSNRHVRRSNYYSLFAVHFRSWCLLIKAALLTSCQEDYAFIYIWTMIPWNLKERKMIFRVTDQAIWNGTTNKPRLSSWSIMILVTFWAKINFHPVMLMRSSNNSRSQRTLVAHNVIDSSLMQRTVHAWEVWFSYQSKSRQSDD